MTDIAARVGVSQATVSLVLNGAPGTRISTATREKVLNAAREMGYERMPHSEAGRRVIGLIINELTTSPHVGTLIEGARDEASQNDCLLSIFVTGGDPEIEEAALDYLLSRPLIGVVYATLLTQGVKPPDRLKGTPTVLPNCHHLKSPHPSVVPGDVAGGFTATTALLEAGHRRIAMINGEDWIEASRDRVQGYRQALTSHDIAVDPALFHGLDGACTFAEICWNVIRKPDGNPYEFAARLLIQPSAHQSWSSWPCPSRCQLDP